MTINASFCFLALCLFTAPALAGDAPAPYTREGYFTIVPPAGWTAGSDASALSDKEKKVFGAEFTGPASGEIASRISVRYYAPGNLLHKTMERFIRLHSRPPFGVNTDKKVYGPVKDGLAGNYHAKVFERKVFEYVPAGSMDAKKTPVYEYFAVVRRAGFYVLRYTAPADIAKANYKAYEAVLASFKPLVK
jgi:hypothetical protein